MDHLRGGAIVQAKIKAGATIWDIERWPNIEYGDVDIIFEVKDFGNPEYVLCLAPSFGLEPYGNGPLYVKKKDLEMIKETNDAPEWLNSIFGGGL